MAEAPLSESAVYTARPTVRIDGQARERVSGLILAMEMHEQEEGLSRLELRLSNIASDHSGGAGFAFEDERSFKLGDRIGIYCGQERSPQEVFTGTITGLEASFFDDASPTLTILAEDKLQSARFKRRTKTHEGLTLASLANQVAGDLGLTPQVTGLSQQIGTQVQLNESDLAFLRRLLARYDGDMQIVGSELHVSPRSSVRRGMVELRMHSQLYRATVLADLSHQVSEVTVTGWDAAQGARVTGRSSGSDTGPGTGRAGKDLLSSALGSRPHQISHLAVTDDAEARAIAQAAFDERRRRFVTVRGTAEGNPAIRVGAHVKLTGLGPRFSNTYYVVRCIHRFDLERGYETDFIGECAFLGSP
jgi:phage protein D